MNSFSTLTLALLFATLLAACSRSSAPVDQASLVDIAQAAARQDDRVTVEQLATWLIEERQNFLLVDVRSPADFEKGQIGAARNIPIAELVTSDILASLPTDRKIVLYSNGSENAAKAEVMLRLAGLDAHLLANLQVSEQRAYSCYFVGERSENAAKRASQANAPFVPPVFFEEENLDAPLEPVAEEAC
jgi:rhodanese-related sulfurtransferase